MGFAFLSALLGATLTLRAQGDDSRIVGRITSGAPTLRRASDGDAVRWHDRALTVYIDKSIDELGDGAREAVQAGFGSWIASDARLPALAFDTTRGARFDAKPNGKSEISYGRITIAGHEKNLALTVTYSDERTGKIVEADTVFNSDYPYALLPATALVAQTDGADATATVDAAICDARYDLQDVAAHEVGHFFGLGEDYTVKEATMYFSTGRCETNKRELHQSDLSAVSELYATAADGEEPASASGKGCSVGGPVEGRATPSLSLFGLVLAAGWLRRRRGRRP